MVSIIMGSQNHLKFKDLYNQLWTKYVEFWTLKSFSSALFESLMMSSVFKKGWKLQPVHQTASKIIYPSDEISTCPLVKFCFTGSYFAGAITVNR